ncbi:MAG: bifunctional hydroxymethylpyrimidine kinase/phosphomethylpyrimidine kinase [Verrucomicrobia bacterium]|nr:bifunctional hydroxymethylpyrimidine kinase/phosphomethylpyrimidine kinase [Verrucomicrobiota bacterium]
MLRSAVHIPAALTIAGSDSGGGAGVQADLKVFATVGVHGLSALTCVTAQNPREVMAVEPISGPLLKLQIEAVRREFAPSAVKTGMLYSERLIRIVAGEVQSGVLKGIPLVVDPVMVATSGARLLKPEAIRVMVRLLLPQAALMTPNLDEAEILAETRIHTPEDLRLAAKTLHQRWGCAVLAKGGHLRGMREAIDVFYDGRQEWLLAAPFVKGVSTHGTGCTYSAAITAHLAKGWSLLAAVRAAKEIVTRSIRNSVRAGEHWILNP